MPNENTPPNAAREAGHTPGPWIVDYLPAASEDFEGGFYIQNEDDALAATFAGTHSKANANLMAAAPDLLTALELLLNDADFLATKQNEARKAKARAAIAKALGCAQ